MVSHSKAQAIYHQTDWITGGSEGEVFNPSTGANTTFSFSGNLGTFGVTPLGSTATFGLPTSYAGGVQPLVSQTNLTGVYTFTFDEPILDPILNITSLGTGTKVVSMDLGANAFTSLVDNGNFTFIGNTLTAGEGSGSMLFPGTYSSLSFSTSGGPETWAGFSIATRSLTVPVPEPSNILFLSGLFASGLLVRSRRSVPLTRS